MRARGREVGLTHSELDSLSLSTPLSYPTAESESHLHLQTHETASQQWTTRDTVSSRRAIKLAQGRGRVRERMGGERGQRERGVGGAGRRCFDY